MEDFNERIISGGEMEADNWQYSLRPKKLQEYIGQDKVKDNLSIFIQAALNRNEALEPAISTSFSGGLPPSWWELFYFCFCCRSSFPSF